MEKVHKKGNYSNQKNSEPKIIIREKTEDIPGEQLFPSAQQIVPVKEFDKPLVSLEDAKKSWEQYQQLINALIKTNDIVVVNNVKKAKKSGMNKIARFFGYSAEVVRAYKEKNIGPQGGQSIVWRVWVKAIAPTGRFRVSGAACSSTERRFAHLEHDVYATAETRAKKRAIEELAGMGELELEEEETEQKPKENISEAEPRSTISSEKEFEKTRETILSNAQRREMDIPAKEEGFFEPLASKKQQEMVQGAINKLNWKLTIPLDKITNKQAKAIIDKAILAAKRKGIRLVDNNIDEAEIVEKKDIPTGEPPEETEQ